MPALLQFAQGLGSATFPNPTIAGSTLIVAVANNDVITGITTFTDNALGGSNLYTNSPSSHASTNNTQTDIWFSYYSQFSPFITTKSCTTITAVVGVGNIPWIWIFEVETNQQAGNNPTDIYGNVGPLNGGYPGPSGTPSLFGDFGPMNAYDFCLTICGVGGDSGTITGVDATWTTIGTEQGGNWVAYRYAAQGVDFTPNPTYTNASVTDFCISLTTFLVPSSPPITGNIIVNKVTSPVGSSQAFTFSPSWGVGFTLTDGQSNNSGALAPGTYSVSEAPVPNWTTTTSTNPNALVVVAGQTTTITFTNTFHPPPPPPPSPCAPVDLNNVPVYGVYIPDLTLFIEPASALYTSLVPHAAVTFSETELQGHKEIVVDFNGSNGLWTRDLGTIFTWSLTAKTVLYFWQPSIIPDEIEVLDRLVFHALTSSVGTTNWSHAREANLEYISTSDI